MFVDEASCIGCLKCALVADKTFAISLRKGKARVVNQWADKEELVVEAVEVCPVQCIYEVDRSQLPVLEFVMRFQVRQFSRLD